MSRELPLYTPIPGTEREIALASAGAGENSGVLGSEILKPKTPREAAIFDSRKIRPGRKIKPMVVTPLPGK